MFSKLATFITSLLAFLLFPVEVYAVTVNIDSYPTTITDSAFQLAVSVSGATDGTNYLRADLYKVDTTNYFGETHNGSTWYSGSEGTQYFPVQIVDATGSATFQARVGAPSDTDYLGPGNYKLKIRRYTTSGSSYTFSDPVEVVITVATPTPSPSPTTSPTPTPAPTSTPTPTPSPTPTKTPTPKPTVKPTSSPDVLGESSEEIDATQVDELRNGLATPSPTPEAEIENKNKTPIFAWLLIVVGIIFIGFSVYGIVRRHKGAGSDNMNSG